MTPHDSSPDDDYDDDDLELELEPVDPEILEHERQRTLRQSRKAEDSVDINDVYRSADDTPIEFGDFKKFQFTIRHLLILTALLSIVMAISRVANPCNTFAIGFVSIVAAGWWYVIRHERRQKFELEQRQKAMKARIAAYRAAQDSESSQVIPPPEEVHFDPPPEHVPYKFSFSVKQMFGAFTIAALLLGMINIVGGAENAALVLGAIAVLGLAMHLFGADPPEVVVLSWWLLLVMYILVSLMAAVSNVKAAMSSPELPIESVLANWIG